MHRSKCEKKNVSSFHVLSARLLVKQEALYYTNAKEWEYETRAPDEDVRTLSQSLRSLMKGGESHPAYYSSIRAYEHPSKVVWHLKRISPYNRVIWV